MHCRDHCQLAGYQSLPDESGFLHQGGMITGKILGNRYVINDRSADTSGFVPDMSADIYYEVVRLIQGKLLFLQDHLERLEQSLSGSGIVYPGNTRIIRNLRLLLHENSFLEGNIRICLQRSKGDEPRLLCYFIPYFYPDPMMYSQGVKLVIYPHVRPNPGIKKWDDHFRTSVSKYILDHSVYEAALINDQKEITEGSRSNIFYIDQNGSLITMPETKVLPGITRKYVIEIARKSGVELLEKPVAVNELDRLVSVFLTGTSPMVLPVRQINDTCFDVSHPLLQKLRDAFEQMVQKNLVLL